MVLWINTEGRLYLALKGKVVQVHVGSFLVVDALEMGLDRSLNLGTENGIWSNTWVEGEDFA